MSDFRFPKPFVIKVVTNLSSQLYMEHEKIFEYGRPLDSLVFASVGSLDLHGYFKMHDGDVVRQKVVTIPPGGWFGDYQILLNLRSSWDLEAGQKNKNEKISGISDQQIQVFKLADTKFRKICDEYPDIRAHILTRSQLRRQFFLKVFNENR